MEGLTRNRLMRELRTDPDVNELAERIAERIRTLLFEGDDEIEDSLENIVTTWWPEDVDRIFEDGEYPAADVAVALLQAHEADVMDVVCAKLMPMTIRLLKTGDWRRSDAPPA